ncbi:hypothetical protein MTO96_042690, partial [Rhipicephalus appendiculatus]
YQHRRLLLAIHESGLAVPHRRRTTPLVHRQQAATEPFHVYFAICLCGHCVACIALAAELFKAFRYNRRRRFLLLQRVDTTAAQPG